jgi:hypothetical protein
MNQKQQGIALFASIIFLLLLALIGFSIMKTSMMSIKSAQNDDVSMQAFNQAELTLRVGEDEVETASADNTSIDFTDADDYLYVFPVNSKTISWVNGTSAGNDAKGRYIIEYLGARPIDTESASLKPGGGISGSNIYLSRIIARDSRVATGAQRIIRSTYATIKQP